MDTTPTNERKSLSLREAVAQVLAQLDGPIALEEFDQRVLAVRPSSAKNPRASLHTHLRWEEIGKTLVFLDDRTILPLRIAMRGVRFRIPLARQEVESGILPIEPAFDYFLCPSLSKEAGGGGRPAAAEFVTIRSTVRAPIFGEHIYGMPAFNLDTWFRSCQVRRGDSLLVTIEDWEAGRFRLEHEPAGRRRKAEIARKNRELADILFDMLESARDECLFAYMAIPTAYARLTDPRGYPGDHWFDVLKSDPRMAYNGWIITYSDYQTPLEEAIFGQRNLPEEVFTPAQGRRVYRFKAALWHRPSLWRTIEIQGRQTLADLDRILREAFHHDCFDHMGGFWKRIQRGQGRRFREVDLGSIEPFGGGDGADRHIATLGLEVGGELKYVYDFGDWIEHRLTLEQIAEPESGAQYPRIVGRNPPRYQNCQSCAARGRKVRASWICLECSDKQQRDILVCEKCLEEEHQDHYAEQIFY